jgi:hypothetical protein
MPQVISQVPFDCFLLYDGTDLLISFGVVFLAGSNQQISTDVTFVSKKEIENA